MGQPVDPLSLLKGLSFMLNVKGGVKDVTDMKKIVKLMKDASQLVSRCVYLNILRVTDTTEVLESFLAEGGWQIVHQWLGEAKSSENFALVLEVLKLLQKLPLRIDHLRQNTTAKLVKSLEKSASCSKVKILSKKLVTSWMSIIHDASSKKSATSKKNGKAKTKTPKSEPEKSVKVEKKSKPPTVKTPTFAKFRKTGLESEQPLKKVFKGAKNGQKRSSVDGDSSTVPDKKIKVDPKPQRKITISGGFMDALNCIPEPPVKRVVKRKVSKSKTSTTVPVKTSPGHEVAHSGEAGDFGIESMEVQGSPSPVPSPTEPSKPKLNKYGKPMKVVKWETDSRLETIRYFEVELGERVNVSTQSFKDALHRDRLLEREKMGDFHHVKPSGNWRKPKLISNLSPPLVVSGCNSTQKSIQEEREKSVLQEIFLSIEMVPESPTEPDIEAYDLVQPKIIPTDDPNDPGPVISTPSPSDHENSPTHGETTNGPPDIKDKLREILQTANSIHNEKANGNNPMQHPPPMMMDPHFNGNIPFNPNVPPPGGMYYPPPMMMGPPPNGMGPMGPLPHWGNRPPMGYPPNQYPPNGNWRPQKNWRGKRPEYGGRWNNSRGKFRR